MLISLFLVFSIVLDQRCQLWC